MRAGKNILTVLICFLSVVSLFSATNRKPEINGDIGYKQAVAGDMVFQWKIENGLIKIKLSAPTTGWLSVGIDPGFAMKDANIIIGYISNDQVVLRDDYGVKPFHHDSITSIGGVDKLQNISGSVIGNTSEISFSLPVDPGDNFHKKIVQGKKYKFIFAYGATADISKKHMKRYAMEIDL